MYNKQPLVPLAMAMEQVDALGFSEEVWEKLLRLIYLALRSAAQTNLLNGGPVFPNDLLQSNASFAAQRTPQPLAEARGLHLAVVTCFDPRLDAVLRPALGLAKDEGFFLRTAGALVSEGSTVLRSLAVAVLMFEVRQVFVLGHSTCRMAEFDNNEFTALSRTRNIAQEAFETENLANWAGAIASPEEGVKRSLAAIAAAPFVPADLVLAGGILNETTGRIELVVGPEKAR